VIKAIDATQGEPPPEPSGAEHATVADPVERLFHDEKSSLSPDQSESGNPKSEFLNSKSDIPLLTPEEKRRILARIARVNATDCFDDTGAFDIARAKRVLPPGAVRSIAIHETIRPNAEGQPITERRIHLGLVDPVSALRLDDLLEHRRERTTSSSSSGSSSSTKNFSRRDFNLLTEKTMALDDTLDAIELLKKALAEANDQELQLSKELEEKDRQLSETLSKVEGEAASKTLSSVEGQCSLALQSRDQSREAGFSTPLSGQSKTHNSSSTALSSRNASTQGDAGCQHAEPKYQTAPPVPVNVADQTLDKHRALEIQRRNREIEHTRNTSGTLGFAKWLRIKQKEWAEIDAQASFTEHHATPYQKNPAGQLVAPAVRPPP